MLPIIIIVFGVIGWRKLSVAQTSVIKYSEAIKTFKNAVYSLLGAVEKDDYLNTLVNENARTIIKIPSNDGKSDYLWQISSDIVDSKEN